MAAFFVLFETLVVVPSRVVLRLAVGVVGFDVGGVADARGVRGCGTTASFSAAEEGLREKLRTSIDSESRLLVFCLSV